MSKRKSVRKPSIKLIIGIAAAAILAIIILASGGGKKKSVQPEPTVTVAQTAYVTVAPATIPPTAAPTVAPMSVHTSAPRQTDAPAATVQTLKKGSTGQAVKDLQQRLIDLGYLSGSADGDFGNKTAQAVKDFQVVHRLTEDGVAGPKTIEQIYSRYARKNRTVYMTKTGTVYHLDDDCSGMKSPKAMSLPDAIRQGYTPCDRCAN